jgi:hypothetical protein
MSGRQRECWDLCVMWVRCLFFCLVKDLDRSGRLRSCWTRDREAATKTQLSLLSFFVKKIFLLFIILLTTTLQYK